jgi:hypothetical protein
MPRLFAILVVLALGTCQLTGCGDDTANPSNPDASAAKDSSTGGGPSDAAKDAIDDIVDNADNHARGEHFWAKSRKGNWVVSARP